MPVTDSGTYVIKCVKPGGLTLTGYGQYTFAEDEELDLLAEAVPETLRCAGFGVAQNVCSDPSLEIAQLIAVGDLQVIEAREPAPIMDMRG